MKNRDLILLFIEFGFHIPICSHIFKPCAIAAHLPLSGIGSKLSDTCFIGVYPCYAFFKVQVICAIVKRLIMSARSNPLSVNGLEQTGILFSTFFTTILHYYSGNFYGNFACFSRQTIKQAGGSI